MKLINYARKEFYKNEVQKEIRQRSPGKTFQKLLMKKLNFLWNTNLEMSFSATHPNQKSP